MEVADVKRMLQERQWTVAVAESLTGGLLTNRFTAEAGASEWCRGGIVAYSRQVKHRLLGVAGGKVVTEACALQMAESAARLLDAQVAVSATGAAGPDSQDGEPPGTAWIGVYVDGHRHAEKLHFDGDPPEVCRAVCDAAVDLLGRQMRQAENRPSAGSART